MEERMTSNHVTPDRNRVGALQFVYYSVKKLANNIAFIAQFGLVRLTLNQEVVGSSPTGVTERGGVEGHTSRVRGRKSGYGLRVN